MSVVMENGTYCPDFKIVLEYFEYLFERFVTEHSVIKQNEEGVLEYTVRKFEERPDDVDWLKTNLPNIFTAGRTQTEHYDSSFSMGSLGQVVSFVKPIGESQLQDAFRKYTWLSISSDIVDKPVLKEETSSQIELDLQELIQGLHAFNAFLLPIAANPTRENARDLEQIYRKVSEILLNLSRYVPTIEDAEENAAFRDVWGKYESLSGIIKALYERTNSVADDMRHDEVETQYCYSCKRNKPLSEFESSEATICKECQKKKQVEERRLSSRVCVKCGKTKPVSAFSQTGGDVCNTCFHKNKAKEKKKKDEKKENPLEKIFSNSCGNTRKFVWGHWAFSVSSFASFSRLAFLVQIKKRNRLKWKPIPPLRLLRSTHLLRQTHAMKRIVRLTKRNCSACLTQKLSQMPLRMLKESQRLKRLRDR